PLKGKSTQEQRGRAQSPTEEADAQRPVALGEEVDLPTDPARLPAGESTAMEKSPAGKTGIASEPEYTLSRKQKAQGKASPPPPLPRVALARLQRGCWGGFGDKSLETLLDVALELVPSEAGTAYEVEEGTGDLRFAAVWGPRARRLTEAASKV